MRDIFAEAKRGLDQVVTTTTADTWVNKEDRAQPRQAPAPTDAPQVAEGPRVESVTGRFDVEPVVTEDTEIVNNPAATVDKSDVPSGNIKKVLAWVDGDKDRAQAALEVENEDETPRSTLITELEEIIEG